MKLLGADASPFVQRVKISAALLGIDLPQAPLPEGGLKGEAVLRMNPMGRMPILVADDGWVLAESAAIAIYLSEITPGSTLLPDDARDRARMRWLVQLVDGPFDAGVRNLVRSQVVPGSASPIVPYDSVVVADLAVDELNEALAAVATVAPSKDSWISGDQPTLADAALFPLLTMLDVLAPWNKARDRIAVPPSLADYRKRLGEEAVFSKAASELGTAFEQVAAAWGLLPA